jgi:midasin (ATPase involved in ribosome maturation)
LQPGALAVAVMTGKLVLLEDIDRAPPDVSRAEQQLFSMNYKFYY